MHLGIHEITPCRRLKMATYIEVCKWVSSTWNKIGPETICKGFGKAGNVYRQSVKEQSNTDKSDEAESSGNTSDISERRESSFSPCFIYGNDKCNSLTDFEGFQESDDD